jgi:hypothetical protein
MRASARHVGGGVEKIPRLQRNGRIGCVNVVAGLHGADIAEQLVGREEHLITDAKLRLFLSREDPAPVTHLDDRVFRRALRLALEQVGERGYRVELVGLVGVELQLHHRPVTPS